MATVATLVVSFGTPQVNIHTKSREAREVELNMWCPALGCISHRWTPFWLRYRTTRSTSMPGVIRAPILRVCKVTKLRSGLGGKG